MVNHNPRKRSPSNRKLIVAAVLLSSVLLVSFGTSAQDQSNASIEGKFLVAAGKMGDPRFHKSVIYMLDHDSKGAMGLIVNKVIGELQVGELLAKMGEEAPTSDQTLQLYFGGPVEMERPFLLHTTDIMFDSSTKLADGVAMSGHPEVLRAIAEGKGPRGYVFVLGYAGWGPGQLEGEMSRGDWVTLEATSSMIFSENPEKTWEKLMEGTVFRL
jgi:putative transcriptional regulator